MGFVVADLGGGGWGGRRWGTVGWVGEDGVEGLACYGGEEVGLEEADPIGKVEATGVLAGDGEGLGGDVEGGDAGLREVMGDGDGYGSGAGAYVGYAEGLVRIRARGGELL